MSFLVIPYLKVQAANFQSNGLLMGGAPLMATAMFSHNLARQIDADIEGFYYIHHDMQRLGGLAYGRFTPAQRRGAVFIGKNDYSSKNKYALSLQPTASCHLLVSLVIEFNEKRFDLDTFVQILKRSKFAGGQITEFGQLKEFNEADEALKHISSGFLVQDRHDLLEKYQLAYQVNRLQAFTQLLTHRPTAKDAPPALELLPDESLAWLSATTMGYALLEPETFDRTGIRHADDQEQTAHAYAEPLTGLIQYISLNQVLDDYASERPLHWNDLDELKWSYHWQQQDIFLLQQNSN
nr:type I-F CRISPR-associated protein Csy2 [Acinetobacter sp. Marseille-Q1620]